MIFSAAVPSAGTRSSSSIYCLRSLFHQSSSSSSVRPLSTAPSATSQQILTYNKDTGIISDARSMQQLYQTIIGIEIHAQLSIPTKLFSSAPTRHESHDNKKSTSSPSSTTAIPSNTNVHPFDIAYPGTLPTLSHSAIKASILSAASLNCRTIHHYSKFERKHYFYADLPQGYQITQQRWPLASEGLVTFLPYSNQQQLQQQQQRDGKDGDKKKRRRGRENSPNKQEDDTSNHQQQQHTTEPVQLRIERIQIEQDTGKTTTHTTTTTSSSNDTTTQTTTTTAHINYNRAGCALIEIVSYPDLRSAHEAAGAVDKIRKLLKHVGSCDGKMEEGSLRCDLNVSIAPFIRNDTNDESSSSSSSRYTLPLGNGHRVEVKNLNSLRQIIAATEYEALRQSSLALQNKATGRETRTFHVKPTTSDDPLGGETICIRAKGDAIDYRFMPEPDLPPLILDGTTLGDGMTLSEFLKKYMPESAEDATARLMKQYSLGESVATLIASDPPAIGFFEDAVSVAKAELRVKDDDSRAEEKSLEEEQQQTDNTIIDDNSIVSALVANYLCNDLYALIKKSAIEEAGDDEDKRATLLNSISVDQSTVDSQRIGLLIAMIVNGSLTTSMAKKILTMMYKDEITSSPRDIATANGWEVISDVEVLTQLCKDVVHNPENTKQLEQYKQGGKNTWKIEKFFIGKVMAQSNGNAHPEKMKEALTSVLEKGVSG